MIKKFYFSDKIGFNLVCDRYEGSFGTGESIGLGICVKFFPEVTVIESAGSFSKIKSKRKVLVGVKLISHRERIAKLEADAMIRVRTTFKDRADDLRFMSPDYWRSEIMIR